MMLSKRDHADQLHLFSLLLTITLLCSFVLWGTAQNNNPNALWQGNGNNVVHTGWLVGVGTSTPTAELDIIGSIRATGHLSGDSIEQHGLDVGGTMTGMTRNIEENRLDITTLYKKQQSVQQTVRQLEQQNSRLMQQNALLMKRLKALEKRLEQSQLGK